MSEKQIEEVLKLCKEIRCSRSSIYGENWRQMSLRGLLYGACYKVERAIFTKDRYKRLDDVLDAINYLLFISVKILEEIEP